jgi:uncharacterized RDD family membrane protein YckC
MNHVPMNPPASSNTCPKCGVRLPSQVACVCPVCLIDSTESHACLFASESLQLPYRLGPYLLVSKLGEGGMGVVFEAEHEESGRRLALKILKEFVGDERERKRFLREGELASTIDHPHSVYIFGTEEIDGLLVIAMELATAGTLRDEVRSRGPLPIREAVDRILEVLSALEVAHSKGVLHRDIKPANCFLDVAGRTLIGDYGLSISPLRHRNAEPLTQSGSFIGTPSYCAPEQIRGLSLDARADFYSLAGTLYFLLSGKSPVETYSSVEAIAAALEGRIPCIREQRPEVPKELAAVLTRALHPSPEKRFQDHAAFRQALLPWSSQAPAPAPVGVRFLAGLADFTLLGIGISVTYASMADADGAGLGWREGLIALLFLSVGVFWECLGGASPGKWLLGLRLAVPGGGPAPASKVLLRAALFAGILFAVSFFWIGLQSGLMRVFLGDPSSIKAKAEFGSSMSQGGIMEGPFLTLLSAFLLLALLVPISWYFALFRRMGRDPEHAALHDRLTGLRVVVRPASPVPMVVPEAFPVPLADLEAAVYLDQWGPISVGPMLENGLRLGLDPVLHRGVLLEKQSLEVSQARKWGARATRLRWLQSVRDPEGSFWNVWQAPSGSPLIALPDFGEIPWHAVLEWMRQIAHETSEAAKEGTLPGRLSLEHVWITADLRAILLDFPWRRPVSESEEPPASGARSPLQESLHLLSEMAECCPPWRRPLHSDALFESLQTASIERFTHLLGLLEVLRKKKTALSRKMRECVTLVPFLVLLSLSLLNGHWARVRQEEKWEKAFPGLPPLPRVLNEMGAFYPTTPSLQKTVNFTTTAAFGTNTVIPWVPHFSYTVCVVGPGTPESTALSTHIRGHYSSLFREPEGLETRALRIPERDETMLRGLVGAYRELPAPDAESLAEADRFIQAFLQRPWLGVPLGWGMIQQLFTLSYSLGVLLKAASLLQLLSILVWGSPLLMRLTGITCVSRSQRPAGRFRMIARWALGWIPTLSIHGALLAAAFGLLAHPSLGISPLVPLLAAPLLGLVAVGTLLLPKNRGLLDRLAGTWKIDR